MQATNSNDASVPHTVKSEFPVENSASQPLPAPQQPTSTWDDIYAFENAVFEVEGTRFKVPKKPIFDASSNPDLISQFKCLGRSGGGNEEVYMLEGVTKDEFKVLLKVLFPLPFSAGSQAATHTTKEWISVLQISHQWCMDAITVQAATRIMSATDISSIGKLSLAVKHNIPPLKQKAYMEFIERDESPTPNEISALGKDATIRIFWAREQNLHQYRPSKNGHGGRKKFGPPRASEEPKFPFDALEMTSPEGTAVLSCFGGEILDGDPISSDLIDIILKAKQSGVKRWLQEAYGAIVKRDEALTSIEAERLDLVTAWGICLAREEVLLGYKLGSSSFGYPIKSTEELYQAAWGLNSTSRKRKAAEQPATHRIARPIRTRPVSSGRPSSSTA